jgi:hypothetical protein
MKFDLKKNDLRGYLEGESVTSSQLSEKAKKAIDIFYKMKTISDRHPDNKDMISNANKARDAATKILEAEVKKIKSITTERKSKATEKRTQRSESLKVVKETSEIKSSLDECRKVIREDRKKRVQSGEIKPPKKKTRTTKMMELFDKVLKLCPSDDPKIIAKAEKELTSLAQSMFKLYGLNRIESVVSALEETSKKKQDRAVKEARKEAA